MFDPLALLADSAAKHAACNIEQLLPDPSIRDAIGVICRKYKRHEVWEALADNTKVVSYIVTYEYNVATGKPLSEAIFYSRVMLDARRVSHFLPRHTD